MKTDKKRIPFSTRAAGVVVSLVMTLTGSSACSSTELEPSPSPSCGSGDDPPPFSGPWADEFRKAFVGAKTDIARQILCDGTITEAEAAELNASLRWCLENLGLIDIEIGECGTLSFGIPAGVDPEIARSQEATCETETGWRAVIPLYNEARTNPEHTDMNQLIADCLVRFQLRPPGFSAADVNAEYDGGNPFSDIGDDPRLGQCLIDPLHAH